MSAKRRFRFAFQWCASSVGKTDRGQRVPGVFQDEEGEYTMSVSQHDWSLHRKGQIDQERHKEKIREAIKKNLHDIVSEEGIILSDGKKMVRVPIRSLDEYRFRYDPGRQQHAGEGNGKSKVGDVVAQEPKSGKGKKGDAGKEAGYDYYEAEITMEELAAMIFEDLV